MTAQRSRDEGASGMTVTTMQFNGETNAEWVRQIRAVLDMDTKASVLLWRADMYEFCNRLEAASARAAHAEAEAARLKVGIGSAASLIWSINPDYKIRPKAMMDVVLESRLMLLDHFANLLGRPEPWLTEDEAARPATVVGE